MTNSIEIRNLNKKYSNFALKDINFTLPQGCIMGFIGENGAGKTTTIKRMLGLISGGGSAKLLGQTMEEGGNALREQIGVVLDQSFFSPWLSAGDIGVLLSSFYQSWDAHKYRELLERFELPTKKPQRELSKGMNAKLRLATALCHRPKLLILDEPTSGLDPVVRSEVLDLFLEFIQQEDHSIFLSSHITADLEQVADYITFLHRGELVFSEPKDALLEEYAIARCEEKDLASIPQNAIVAVRRGTFGCEALIRGRQAIPFGMVADRPTLDEIMLLIVKGEKK